jgi:hypothetical protein
MAPPCILSLAATAGRQVLIHASNSTGPPSMWNTILIGLVLFGQTPARPPRGNSRPKPRPPAPAVPADDEPIQTLDANEPEPGNADAAAPLVPIESISISANGAAGLIQSALAPPATGGLTGDPIGVTAVVTRLTGRSAQAESVRAYWKLAMALAGHHFALDEHQRMATLAEPPIGDAAAADRLEIEQAASRARLREEELSALAAQHELAVLLGQSADAALPLPADLPLVGSYRTYFAEMFGTREPPPRLALIERTLPVLLRAIELRAEAVTAAEDAWQATAEAYASGDVGVASVADRLADLGRQRRAFLGDVRGYNDLIVEYALSVARDGSTPGVLAAMLVKEPTPPDATGAASPPASEDGPTAAEPAGSEPTPALPRDGEPTPAEPTGGNSPAEDDRSVRTPAERKPKTVRALRPDQSWYADYLAMVDPAASRSTGAADALYSGLASLSTPKRTHKLAAALHWDRSLPPAAGTPIALDEFLRIVPSGNRPEAVAAYWDVREQAARRQALVETAQLYHALVPLVLSHQETPARTRAMLMLRVGMLSADAAASESLANLLASQLRLTSLAGRSLAGPWLVATTPPHAGRYQLATPGAGASRAIRRSTVAVSTSHEVLQDLATAVIVADGARARAAADYEAGRISAEDLTASIEVQTAQTLAFLTAVTRYNLAIADYVAASQPAQMPTDQFVAALVVQ